MSRPLNFKLVLLQRYPTDLWQIFKHQNKPVTDTPAKYHRNWAKLAYSFSCLRKMAITLVRGVCHFSVAVVQNKAKFLSEIKALLSHFTPHYNDVIMGARASQITSLTIVCSTVYSDADERKHQSSASLAFVWGIHRRPVNSPRKWPVTRKMIPFDDVIMIFCGM